MPAIDPEPPDRCPETGHSTGGTLTFNSTRPRFARAARPVIALPYRISSAVMVGVGDRLGFLLCIAIDSEKIEQVVTVA
jgi:hypothetical protein